MVVDGKLMKALAVELSKQSVRVNCICPGSVDTPLLHRAADAIPSDADRKLMARLYSLLPLGRRSLIKLERILRDEMERVGAQEFLHHVRRNNLRKNTAHAPLLAVLETHPIRHEREVRH